MISGVGDCLEPELIRAPPIPGKLVEETPLDVLGFDWRPLPRMATVDLFVLPRRPSAAEPR